MKVTIEINSDDIEEVKRALSIACARVLDEINDPIMDEPYNSEFSQILIPGKVRTIINHGQ